MKRQLHIVTAALALLASAGMAGVTATATVDGAGGASTGDATFPTSYTTVEAALAAVKTTANAAGDNITISITAANAVAEGVAASLDLDTDCNLTIDGNVTGSAYGGELAVLRLTASDAAGSPAGTEGVAIEFKTGTVVTLRDLVMIPNNAAPAGPYTHRMFQVFNSATTSSTVLNFERCIFTARRVSDNSPVINPFVHAASANTKAARSAELCAFDGGGGNNAFVVQNGAAGAPAAGAVLTLNFTDVYFTHLGIMPAAASRGGGIAMARTAEWVININGGCVFSYLDGCGIRGVGTMASATTDLNVNGTAFDPVFFIYNGWMEDAANTARNEGIQNDGSPVSINYAYFIGNYSEGVDLLGLSPDDISNSYFAESQTDLDTGSGTAPDVANAANVALQRSGGNASSSYTLTNVTIYNNRAPNNDQGIAWINPFAGTSLTLSNVIVAGAGDQNNIGSGDLDAASYIEDDCAIVQAGPDSLQSPFETFGAAIVQTVTDRVAAAASDPNFVSTTFAPVFSVPFTAPAGLDDYLRVDPAGAANLAFASAASPARTNPVSAINVTGANPNGAVPVELSVFSAN